MRVKCMLACDEKAALMDSGTPPPLPSSFAQPRPLRQSDKWRASRRIIIRRQGSVRQTHTSPPPRPALHHLRDPCLPSPPPRLQLHSRLHKEMQEGGRGEGSAGMLAVAFSVFIVLKAAGSAAVSAVGTTPRAFARVHA